ncbi:CARDB domain-containing protein [Kaarinaea lacus]
MKTIRAFFILFMLALPYSVFSAEITFTVADVNQMLENALSSGNDISEVVEQLNIALGEEGVVFGNGEVFYDYIPNNEDKEKWLRFSSLDPKQMVYYYKLRNQNVQADLSGNTSFKLKASSFNKPIEIAVSASGQIHYHSKDNMVGVDQAIAYPSCRMECKERILGACVLRVPKCDTKWKRVTFIPQTKVDLNASADVSVDFLLRMTLNPIIDTTTNPGYVRIQVTPTIEHLDIQLHSISNKHIDVDWNNFIGDGDLVTEVNEYIIEEHFTSSARLNSMIGKKLDSIKEKLYIKLAEKILPNSEYQDYLNGPTPHGPVTLAYDLPISEEQIEQIIALLEKLPHAFPITYDYIKDNQAEIMGYLAAGDYDSLAMLLGSSLACQAAKPLLKTMPVAQLSSNESFVEPDMVSFCEEYGFHPDAGTKLGNAAEWDQGGTIDELPWTLSPGTQLDIAAVSLGDNYQPYMKKLRYKTIQGINFPEKDFSAVCKLQLSGSWSPFKNITIIPPSLCNAIIDIRIQEFCQNNFPDNLDMCVAKYKWNKPIPKGLGDCKLEMRVYKKDLSETGLKPLLALHGGSWQLRQGAFVGMEALISQFTERGFVVFAPFYRLLGEEDGNAECNGATSEQLLSDIDDALLWVENNMTRFDASGLVTVFGQSAGSHLAASLSVRHANRIERALLMYPPIDAQDYILGVQNGTIDSSLGESAVKAFLGLSESADLADVDINDPLVVENSFPPMVVQAPESYPPMYMIHGGADAIVPSSQSVRMCNALSGSILNGPAVDDGGNPALGTYSKSYVCDNRGSRMDILAQGDHALELCVPRTAQWQQLIGGKCASGEDQGSVDATAVSLTNAWDWLAAADITPPGQPIPTPVPDPDPVEPTPQPQDPTSANVVMTGLTVPQEATTGSRIEVIAVATNTGTESTNYSVGLNYYVSSDALLDSDDLPIPTYPRIEVLNPGESKEITLSIPIPATLQPGDYHILVAVDRLNFVAESGDANTGSGDVIASERISFDVGADVAVTNLSSSEEAVTGGPLSISATVANIGTGQTSGWSVPLSYYLSADELLSDDDYLFGTTMLSRMQADSTIDNAPTFTVPGNIPVGEYYVIAVVDKNNYVIEQDDPGSLQGNNVKASTAIRIDIGADVSVNSMGAHTSSGSLTSDPNVTVVRIGEQMELFVDVQNIGTGKTNANVDLKIVLSEDVNYDSSDKMITWPNLGVLPAGLQKELSYKTQVPTNTASGQYYIIAIANSRGYVVEQDGGNSNNLGIVPIQVEPPRTDLELTSLSGSSSAIRGSLITLNSVVTNLGEDSTSGNVSVHYYLSKDNVASSDDYFLGAANAWSKLDGKVSVSLNPQLRVPTSLPVGSYYLIGVADKYQWVVETDDPDNLVNGNNVLVGNIVTVN